MPRERPHQENWTVYPASEDPQEPDDEVRPAQSASGTGDKRPANSERRPETPSGRSAA